MALSSRSTGLFLHVSLDDGLLKAGSKTASDKESHFYVVPVTEATVASLRVASTLPMGSISIRISLLAGRPAEGGRALLAMGGDAFEHVDEYDDTTEEPPVDEPWPVKPADTG